MFFNGWIIINVEIKCWKSGNNPQPRPMMLIGFNIPAFQHRLSGGGIKGEMTVFALNRLPIPQISTTAQQPFIKLVDKILQAKIRSFHPSHRVLLKQFYLFINNFNKSCLL
jgi:hypothetical protein